jgi:queuine tRNA-ribosyltransferase
LSSGEAAAGELVIWDVGLGAAFNAMAAIRCFEGCAAENRAGLRPLRVVSFERDLDPLTLAVTKSGHFPHLRHAGPSRILQNGEWRHASGLCRWELRAGDFRDALAAAAIPDLIFYDPFSFKTDAALWTADVFAQIFRRALPKPSELYTYSASTAVRAALLAAGFWVAVGAATGPKSDTTIAFTAARGALDHPASPRLLGAEWLARWRRSGAKFPADVTGEARARFEKLIESHPQFGKQEICPSGSFAAKGSLP